MGLPTTRTRGQWTASQDPVAATASTQRAAARRVDGPVDPSRRAASLGELQALSADTAKRPARGAANALAFIGLDTAIDKHVTNWN